MTQAVRVLVVLLLAGLLPACSNASRDTSTLSKAVRDSVPAGTEAVPVQAAETECVFDTSTYRFTTQALRKPNPQQPFTWDQAQQWAVAPLPDGDTLILRIGGCNHFSFLAVYRTDSARFNQEAYLFGKAQWLAETYFDDGFDKDYARFIANRQYQLEESGPDLKWYTIAAPDTTVTNRIFEGFYFKKAGARTEIWIHGYLN
jgi:hypothetical protein